MTARGDLVGPDAVGAQKHNVYSPNVLLRGVTVPDDRFKPMAIRGRASFLGERSVGHMDPGARSSALIVDAVADVMEGLA